jgi:FtsP/CotA-like multicopper oxidase with cupredoxin domain
MLWICRLRRRQSLGRQELIGRSDSLERLFGSTVAGVSVGVTPEGGLPKGALDLGRRRTLREAKRGMGFATVHCQSLLLCSLIFAQILAANMGRRRPGSAMLSAGLAGPLRSTGWAKPVTIRAGQPGLQTEFCAYNGIIPGPLVESTAGDRVRILFENRIPGQVSTIHWHGMPVPAAQDGNPMNPVTRTKG